MNMPQQPVSPSDYWSFQQNMEMNRREQMYGLETRRDADEKESEKDSENQSSRKMFHIEQGPEQETAGQMYRRIKAESKRPKNHAFRNGIMKGFFAAVMSQKAAQDDLAKQQSDSPQTDCHEETVDKELEELRKSVQLGEGQTLVRMYHEDGSSEFGVIDRAPGASPDNVPDLPVLPNGKKPKYVVPDKEDLKSEQKPASKPVSQKQPDLTPAGRKLPDISHIKAQETVPDYAFTR